MSETAERLTVSISDTGCGIGRTTSERLLSRGYTVEVLDISGDQGWTADHQSAVIDTLSVINPQQWEDMSKQFVDRVRYLGVLVNNAGILYDTSLGGGFYKQDDALIDANVKGVHFGYRAALPCLKGSRGQTVNLCSASAIYGAPGMAIHSVIKSAARGIAEALGVEWEPHGIDVKTVQPPYVGTPMLKNVNTDGTKRMGARITSDDVANAIINCINHEQGEVTKVHSPVGPQTKLLYYAAGVDAPLLNRFINTKLTMKQKIDL